MRTILPVDATHASSENPVIETILFGTDQIPTTFTVFLYGYLTFVVLDESEDNGRRLIEAGDECPQGEVVPPSPNNPRISVFRLDDGMQDVTIVGCDSNGLVVAIVILDYQGDTETEPMFTFPPATEATGDSAEQPPTETGDSQDSGDTEVPTSEPTKSPTAGPTFSPTARPTSRPTTSM